VLDYKSGTNNIICCSAWTKRPEREPFPCSSCTIFTGIYRVTKTLKTFWTKVKFLSKQQSITNFFEDKPTQVLASKFMSLQTRQEYFPVNLKLLSS
jgi:hypothetical protein